MENKNLTNRNDEELILINTYEELAQIEVKSLIKNIDMCRCERCIADACAITLNALPPKYVVTHKGELLARLDTWSKGIKTELSFQAMTALLFVKDNPRH